MERFPWLPLKYMLYHMLYKTWKAWSPTLPIDSLFGRITLFYMAQMRKMQLSNMYIWSLWTSQNKIQILIIITELLPKCKGKINLHEQYAV